MARDHQHNPDPNVNAARIVAGRNKADASQIQIQTKTRVPFYLEKLALGIVDELLQAGTKLLGKTAQPCSVDQPDVDQIAEMCPVLVTK